MLTLKIEGLDALKQDFQLGLESVSANVRWAMVQSVGAVQIKARSLVPYKTGKLRQSIFTEIENNGFRGIVGQDRSNADYGVYHEYGTSPYTITPTRMRALYWKGALHPVKSVQHPGLRARPFMTPGLEQSIDKITSLFEQAVEKIIKVIEKG